MRALRHVDPEELDGRPVAYNHDRCRYTAGLRRRNAEMAERIDFLEAMLSMERAAIAEERAALNAHLGSPEAQLAGLETAQATLRAEAVTAARTRKTCGTCGGLGRGFADKLLVERITTHCEAHGLQPARGTDAPMRVEDWPYVQAGRMQFEGRTLGTNWHAPQAVASHTVESTNPYVPPRDLDPPHWRRRNPHDIADWS